MRIHCDLPHRIFIRSLRLLRTGSQPLPFTHASSLSSSRPSITAAHQGILARALFGSLAPTAVSQRSSTVPTAASVSACPAPPCKPFSDHAPSSPYCLMTTPLLNKVHHRHRRFCHVFCPYVVHAVQCVRGNHVRSTLLRRGEIIYLFFGAPKLVRKHCAHALALSHSYAAYNESCSSCDVCQPLPVVQENWYRRLLPLPAQCVLQ